MSTKKLWGGRFEESAAAWIDQFGASISFDQLMANEDIEGSLAHVKMLNETGILTEQEATEIENGLLSLKDDLSAGKLEFSDQNEDIHMNIESLLTEKIGPVAGKLHTARSRNDQVATDFHLYVKKRTTAVISELKKLQKALVEKAEANVETIMPGYTHMQHAQPISYAHYLLAYFEMFKRDRQNTDSIFSTSGKIDGRSFFKIFGRAGNFSDIIPLHRSALLPGRLYFLCTFMYVIGTLQSNLL